MMQAASGSVIPTSASSQGTFVPSNQTPSSDMNEDYSSKLSAYLNIISGCTINDADSIVIDHCYCRPWNWRPENVYVKPMRKLFFSNPNDKTDVRKANNETEIDVECDDKDVDILPPIDMKMCRQNMDESMKLSKFVRPDEIDDDNWEEKVEKLLWSPLQRRLFNNVYNLLSSERLIRLTRNNSNNEPIYRRLSIDSTSKKFREILSTTGWDIRVIQWLHELLFDHLPQEYLTIYLDILQTLKTKIPQLIDKILTVLPNAPIKLNPIPMESITTLFKRHWDPFGQCLNTNRLKKLPSNPILIVLPSGIGSVTSNRHQKWLTQLGSLGTVVNVHSHLGISANRMTMMACMDQLVQTSRSKLQEVREDYPGRPMILIGFNTGAALACQVAQMDHVTAVVCLGFPFSTVEGKRGSPDDILMDIRCPVIFVIGQNATLVKPDEINDIREKMLVETGLVVVGTADDHLRISTTKKMTDGITQSVVDRCILNEVGDFLGGILLQPHPLPLRTTTVMNYDKSIQRELRKRKNSTSSSVESESNCSVKRSRPPTPVDRQQQQTQLPLQQQLQQQLSISMQPSITITKTPVPLHTPINHGTIGGTTITSTPIQKRKPRMSNNVKISVADTRNAGHKPLHPMNNGIPLNINTMATVTPVVGPLRVSTNTNVNQPVANTLKPSLNSNNLINKHSMPKVPKMIHTGTNNQKMNKTIKTLSPANKMFTKINSSPDSAHVTMVPTGGNQLRITSTGIQNKPASNNSSITAVLHSRKNFGNTIVNIPEGISITPTNQIIGESSHINSLASSSKTKESNHGIMIDSSISGGVSLNEMNESTGGTIKILPWTNKLKTEHKNTHDIPRITMSNTTANKNQCTRFQTLVTVKNDDEMINFDDDLGNILDIPIIFAKDDDSLNAIDQSIPIINPTEVCDQNKTRPTTKIVLLTSKDDRTPPTTCDESIKTDASSSEASNHVVLPTCGQSAISWNDSPPKNQSNNSGVKYTKIILSKRGANSSDQVVLTKNTRRATSSRKRRDSNYMLSIQNVLNDDDNSDELFTDKQLMQFDLPENDC